MKRKAVYAGTFDPITYGHIDIIKRASRLFDTVIVAVADSKHKRPFFTREERVDMAKHAVKGIKGVSVDTYSGLLVNFLKKTEVCTVIRGLRAISDFEYEFQLALINKSLFAQIEMIYMMPEKEFLFVSSSSVKEITSYGGKVTKFVPAYVARKLKTKRNDLKRA